MPDLKLQDIYIYPVKSCAGIRVNTWQVTEKGLQYDRQWMIVDQNQQFLSQRKLPKMALIRTQLTGQKLVLSAPDKKDLALSLQPFNDQLISVEVWNDICQAKLISAEADQWLSEFLNQPCRLVFQPDTSIRKVDPTFAKASDQVYFSDGFPFLIISENSLTALNNHLPSPISMARFRPNLVISGSASYEEDIWREISIGEISFRLPKPCSRCSVPGINPETGESSKEPLKTLNQLRKWQKKVYFGQNALHNGPGKLSVGDPVKISVTGVTQPLLI